MQSLNPIYNSPSTPANSRTPLQHKPLNSSPLASQSPKMSSPLLSAQARRRSQYKPQVPSTPSSTGKFLSRRLSSAGNTPTEEDPQKAFLRSRFKARCLERAVKARENAIRGRRAGTLSEPSSDDYPMDDDEEEEDDDIMQDELFRRIMANVNQKQRHSYRVSYAQEVGSSFDPDLEDISGWEQELATPAEHPASNSATDRGGPSNLLTSSTPEPSDISWMQEPEEELPEDFELSPEDLGDEELEAYAEECSRRAVIADFEDIPPEDLFNWSEGEDIGTTPIQSSVPYQDDDDGMDMS